MKMAGREVFKAAVLAMAEACDEALKRAGVTGRRRSICSFRTRPTCASSKRRPSMPAFPMSKVMVNLDRYGNTSSASIPLALDQAVAEGRVGPGSLIMLVAFGAGLHLGERGRPVVTRADVPRPGRAAGRDGEGPRRAVSRRPRYLRRHRRGARACALSRLMWEGPEDELTLTHNAQPAILAHTAAVLAVVADRLGIGGRGRGAQPRRVQRARRRRARSPRRTRRGWSGAAAS